MKCFSSALLLTTLAVLAACGSSTGGGTGGTAGSGGHATTSSSSSSSSSTSTSGAAGGCQGDATTWATLTAGPIPCVSNADCCVILNGCTNEAQIVSATNKDAAKAAWPYCDNGCTNCIPTAIQVGCMGGYCGGESVPFPDASADLLMDHCGAVPVGVTPDKLHFTCGG